MLMGKTSINSADSEANWSDVINFHNLHANECVACVHVYFQ